MKENRVYLRRRQKRFRPDLIRFFLLCAILLILYEILRTHEDAKVLPSAASDSGKMVNKNEKTLSSIVFLYEEDSTLWGFTSGIEALLEKTVSREYWGPSMARSHEGTVDEWTVTNMSSCTRLRDLRVPENEMRNRYLRHRIVKDITGCDSLSVPFNPRRDARCIRFMTNSSNWKEVVPISQTLDQRTIKFTILFHSFRGADGDVIDYPLETIIKMPQRHFSMEAAGEVSAFHVDRLLLMHRVPPTGLACLPVRMIEESVEKYKNIVETTAEYLKISGVNSYEEWVKKDLFDYLRQNNLLERSINGEECVSVSIQLKIADVGQLLSSAMRIPYESHSDTWHAFFNLNNSTGEGPPDFIQEPSYVGILHLATLSMFDYILGNWDRSPNKNNFVVGGTRRKSHLGNSLMLLHPNHPSFIYLDHGVTFSSQRPRRNPITKSHEAFEKNEPDTFCLFHGPLMRRICELMRPTDDHKNETIFVRRMKQRLPNYVLNFIDDGKLRDASRRSEELLLVADRCLKNERIRPYVLFP